MWFGFNFSDAKDYATIAQYQKTFRNKIKTWKTQTRFRHITDENGDPLPGASITIKGTKTTTVRI
jgi:hypothetical protein